MSEQHYSVLFTGNIGGKFEWIRKVRPGQILVGKTYGHQDCVNFSATLAKYNRLHKHEEGFVVLGHYNIDKCYVAIRSMRKEEYERLKSHPREIRSWTQAIPELYR